MSCERFDVDHLTLIKLLMWQALLMVKISMLGAKQRGHVQLDG